ncbi:MAG: MupG family TIM beta-alpha barrel fold protein [Bacillota bacterium]
MIGISVFVGMETGLEENLYYMHEASRCGIKHLFTSSHIPEARESYKDDLSILLKEANMLGMHVMMDISKKYFDDIQIKQYRIDSLRLDFGFSFQEIAAITQKYDFNVTLNASTLNKEDLEYIIRCGGNLSKINTCHNYYPRKDTGISEELLVERNKVFREYGLKTMAFVPSTHKRRGPIHEGLPTLEKHRSLHPLISTQHLLRLGTDIVFVGDAKASNAELQKLSKIEKDVMMIPIITEKNMSEAEKRLLCFTHTNRTDPGEYVIRSQESRIMKDDTIMPNNNLERYQYCVTIDNREYKRYEGELQILRKTLPRDHRVNVAADARSAGVLIELLKPGERFAFDFMEDEA